MDWIKVEDKLPELNQPVLCYSPHLNRYPVQCPYDVCIFKGEYTHSAWDADERKHVLQEAYKWPLFERVDTNNTRTYEYWCPIEPPKTEEEHK